MALVEQDRWKALRSFRVTGSGTSLLGSLLMSSRHCTLSAHQNPSYMKMSNGDIEMNLNDFAADSGDDDDDDDDEVVHVANPPQRAASATSASRNKTWEDTGCIHPCPV